MGLFFNKKKSAEQKMMKQYNNNNFKMCIVDTFAMVEGNLTVVGMIESGVCRVGETVKIYTKYGIVPSSIERLEAFRKPLEVGYAGQHIGIYLKGVTKEQVAKDDIIIIENAGAYL